MRSRPGGDDVTGSPAFEWLWRELALTTDMTELEARGTIRLALRAVGHTPALVARLPMLVVIQRVLPGELERRGVKSAPELCAQLATRLESAELGDPTVVHDDPETVFSRLGQPGAKK
jgi:hypothetical protein